VGRPPALDDRQKAEIGRRLAAGESGRKLAKEFGVSEGTIRANISTHPATIRDVANRLASAESDLKRLPVSAQGSVRSLADQLQGISHGLAEVASKGVETGKILAEAAHKKAKALGDAPCPDDLRMAVALQEGANRSVSTAVGMMQANKGVIPDDGGLVVVETGVPHG